MEVTKLTPEEKQELAFTRKRVLYNNKWATNPWKEEAQRIFESRLSDIGKKQIFEGVRLHVDNATEILFRDAQLNKLHSIITDIYDSLPYHPDSAFDQAWSALELSMKLYNVRLWKGRKGNTDIIINDIFTQELPALLKDYPDLKTSLFELVNVMPLSVTRFAYARWFHHRGLEVQSHYGEIQRRTKEIIGEEVYNRLAVKYAPEDDAAHQFVSSQELRDILRGKELVFADKSFDPFDEWTRLRIVVSSLLYTARNERFHGDNFSHFKSDRASLKTYHHFYYLLMVTYSLLWILLLRLCLRTGITTFVTPEQVKASIDKNIEFITTVFKQD